MRIIGVLDLLNGCAVHARAGRRERYQPVQAAAGADIEGGDPVALARIYVDRLGLTELYAADLDAIAGRPRQDVLTARVAAIAPLWLDAAIASARDASGALELGARVAVVGLETLPSIEALEEICARVGGDRVAFSLDLRDGQPIRPARLPREAPHLLAARAVRAGVRALIVIDVARVGTRSGIDIAIIQQVRDAAPGVTLLAGGGVRGADDLIRLADAGCDGALVATALHDGRLDAAGFATGTARQRRDSR
jgi:phosphoribosylformimino-5-aminoimidazole carboxamide ribotide isomerase